MKKMILALTLMSVWGGAFAAVGPTKDMSLGASLTSEPTLAIDFTPIENIYVGANYGKDIGTLVFTTNDLTDITLMSSRSVVDGRQTGFFTFMDSSATYKISTKLGSSNDVSIQEITQGAKITPVSGEKTLAKKFTLKLHAHRSSSTVPGTYTVGLNVTSNVI